MRKIKVKGVYKLTFFIYTPLNRGITLMHVLAAFYMLHANTGKNIAFCILLW